MSRRRHSRAERAARNLDRGDVVWFTRPAYRTPKSIALIDHGVIRAASSGAVVVQTSATNDGPVFYIVPRQALHGLVATRQQPTSKE